MINLVDILNSNLPLSITVSIDDLNKFANYLIEKTKKDLEQDVINDKIETYINRDQVAMILGVDKVTLWRWGKSGYLVPIELGGKRRYRMSEVKALLNKKK